MLFTIKFMRRHFRTYCSDNLWARALNTVIQNQKCESNYNILQLVQNCVLKCCALILDVFVKKG